jgi:tetratricopeptide (TPR) repeat protein
LKLAKSTRSITSMVFSMTMAFVVCLSVLMHRPVLGQPNLLGGSTPATLNPLSNDPTDAGGNQTRRDSLPSAIPQNPNAVFGDKVPDGGWDGLAKLLEALAPSVDTRIPLTPTEISNRIDGLIRSGRLKEALQTVESRQALEALRYTPGTDVQLMFLHARVLSEMNRSAQAEAIYLQMTTRFPELPEPWNNLAALYVKRNELEQARRALEMAVMINPKYTVALANLGDVQLNLALRAYQKASQAGVPGLAPKIKRVKDLLESSPK